MIKVRHRIGLVLVLVCALAPLAILVIMALAECWHRLPGPEDTAFENLVGLPLNTGLYVDTDRRRYSADDYVHMIVQNRTGESLWFEDQSFEVQGFVYDNTGQQWTEIDLGFKLIEPGPVCLQDSRGDVWPNEFSFPTEWIGISTKTTIRLLVTGSTCPPEQQGQGECLRYAAFSDIIVEPDR
jgi:hypothetical protein